MKKKKSKPESRNNKINKMKMFKCRRKKRTRLVNSKEREYSKGILILLNKIR